MQPVATIKLRYCYRCDALCGPEAGKMCRVKLLVTGEYLKMWLCNECIEEVLEIGGKAGEPATSRSRA